MPRVTSFALVLISLLGACALSAQDDPTAAAATCNFDQDTQLAVQYQQLAINPRKPIGLQVPYGRPWAPGGKPMTLFANTSIAIGGRTLPIGAYTIFVIPTSRQWTMIISKSTNMTGAYDEQQDILRVPMETGELPSPEPEFRVSFAHIAPDQCSIRLDMDKYGHFAVFQKK